jgi:alpha-tubulin suppressor-like RCC1 family protein
MVPLTVSGIAGAVTVSPGYYHTCAIQSDGTLWCWGRNDYGELGNGTTTSSFTPTQVPGIVNPVALAAGGLHTCVRAHARLLGPMLGRE